MGFIAKIAFLNGYVTGKEEKVCSKYPFTNEAKDFWKNKILSQSTETERFEIIETNITNISEEFAIVINPFGEIYPEINLKSKIAFNVIKNFIEEGGIYVNTAGFPFFYAWNVVEGKDYPLSEETIFMPNIEINKGVPIIKEMQTLLSFTGTLLFREFDAMPAPNSKERSSIFQTEEDIEKFGNLTEGITSIKEFRAMPKLTRNCVPIIRAKDEAVGEVYPISALKKGDGYLLLAGMDTSQNREADLFAKALKSFCVWFAKQL